MKKGKTQAMRLQCTSKGKGEQRERSNYILVWMPYSIPDLGSRENIGGLER